MSRPPLDTQSSSAASVSTFTTSEYWIQSTSPVFLRQEIARRAADPHVKQEIANALSCGRLEFKVLWNRALTINQLPNELLIQIFQLALLVGYPENFVNSIPEGKMVEAASPRFLRIVRVCRHWREVVVGTPAFWCFVRLRKDAARWIDLCLTRSVAAPLDIVTSMSHWRDICRHLTATGALGPLIHRIKNLYFGIHETIDPTDPDVLARLQLLFGDGMPTLERLHLVFMHSWGQPDDLPIDVEVTCQRFPRLRRLALSGVVAPQDPSVYTSLHTLSLTRCSHTLSFDRFLATLASCPALTLLHLDSTVDRLSGGAWLQRDPPTPSPSPRKLISLPRLVKFAITGHRAGCTARFLVHFHIAASVRLVVAASPQPGDPLELEAGTDARAGACLMAAMLPPSHAATLAPLAAPAHAHLCMWSGDEVEIMTPGGPGGVVLRMRLTAYDGRQAPTSPSRWGAAGDLARLLGHAPLTSLEVSCVLPDAVSAWSDVFPAFPRLERLEVEGTVNWECPVGMENAFLGLHAASASVAGLDPGSRSTVACPRLKYVAVHGYGSTAVYEAIRTCFRYRKDRGVMLAELDIDLAEWWQLCPARCCTCARDLVDCTEHLNVRSFRIINEGEGEEGENVRAAWTETEVGGQICETCGAEGH